MLVRKVWALRVPVVYYKYTEARCTDGLSEVSWLMERERQLGAGKAVTNLVG